MGCGASTSANPARTIAATDSAPLASAKTAVGAVKDLGVGTVNTAGAIVTAGAVTNAGSVANSVTATATGAITSAGVVTCAHVATALAEGSSVVMAALERFPPAFFEFSAKLVPVGPRKPEAEKAPRFKSSKKPGGKKKKKTPKKDDKQEAPKRSVASVDGTTDEAGGTALDDAAVQQIVDEMLEEEDDGDFSEADSTKWSFEEGWRFDGRFSYTSLGDKELVRGVAIAKGVERLKADPVTYAVLWFQAGMEEWPEQQQQFTLLRRAGTRGFRPSGVSKTAGAFQFAFAHYLRLPPVHSLLEPALDNFMSSGSLASYNGAGLRLHASPGRGEGLGDIPGLKLIGDIDPNDGTRPAPPPTRKTMTALKSVVRGASSP